MTPPIALSTRNLSFQDESQSLNKVRSFSEKFSKEKQRVDRFEKVSKFVTSSYGSKKLFKVFYLSCKWPINFEKFLKLNPNKVKKIIDVKNQFKKVTQSLNVTKVFSSIKNVKKISINIQRKDFKNSSKKIFKIAMKVVQAILDILTFIGLGQLFCFYKLGNANNVLKCSKRLFKVVMGSFFLFKSRTKYIKNLKTQKAFESQKTKDPRMKIIFGEIKNLDLLKIIKNIVFIALNLFIVFELIFQIALISTTLKIALSTISLALSITTYFYKESLTYPKISNSISRNINSRNINS